MKSRVISPSGIVKLYGMTAGHILAQQPPGEYSFDQVGVPDEEDEEDEGFYSGGEEYELDDIFNAEEVRKLAAMGDKTRTVLQSTQLRPPYPKIGSVFVASYEGERTESDHDWALIDFDRVTHYRPNLLVSLDREHKDSRSRPLKENRKSTEDGSSRIVSLLSGTDGIKNGTLSTSLSFLMMGPAKAFMKTYTLVLSRGSGKCRFWTYSESQLMLLVLNAGDCGSWVVDPSTGEVFGHVVASDAMGDIYVIPINATLRDMEKKLGAAVSLPTETDIEAWVGQHIKVAEEQVTVPSASKKKKVAFDYSRKDRVESPTDPQKLAGHSSSRASTILAPSATKTSTSIVDYCNSCNAKFEGTSQDVRDDLLCHQRICSNQKRNATPRTESALLRDAKDSLDARSKSSSVRYSKNVQQKAASNTSTQQSPVPWSIRSMYSSLRKKPGNETQQRDESKLKSVRNSKEHKTVGSAFSTKLAATVPPTSTVKDSKQNTKNPTRKDWASSPISQKLPASSSASTDRISGDLSPTQLPDPTPSFPKATPSSPRLHQDRRPPALHAPPPPHPPPVHGHESFHERSVHSPNQSHGSMPEQVSYEGYTFTKCNSRHAGQKETWAVAHMVPMPVSQKDLKDQIKRDKKKQKKKHLSALDEYNDERMKGFKRKQVDNLIRECTKIDGDYGYEYVLASIKLESRQTKNKSIETVSMQVILKRQLIAGFPHETSTGPSMDLHAKLPSQVMDLTREDVPFAGHPEHEAFPLSPQAFPTPSQTFPIPPQAFPMPPPTFPMPPVPGQPFGHGMQHVDNRHQRFHVPSSLSPFDPPAQDMGQPLHPQGVPLIHQGIQNAQGHLGKSSRSNQKEKALRIVDTKHKPRIENDNGSRSPSISVSSLDSVSDPSWTKTDATPDTELSGQSSEYGQEKIFAKKSKERSHNKDKIEPMPFARPVYREHHRGEHRRSSLSPARRSRGVSTDSFGRDLEHHGRSATSPRRSYSTRYRDHECYEVEPAISFPAGRPSRHRRSSVSPDRLSHRRVPSYDLNSPVAHDSRALVPVRRWPTTINSHDRTMEQRREQERWDIERLQLAEEEREMRRRRREMARYETRREMESLREIERMKGWERRGDAGFERERWPSERTYDDGYMPRYSRHGDYYD